MVSMSKWSSMTPRELVCCRAALCVKSRVENTLSMPSEVSLILPAALPPSCWKAVTSGALSFWHC